MLIVYKKIYKMLAKWYKNHNSWIKKSQHIMVSKLKVISLNVYKRNMDCNLFRIVLRVQFYSRKSFSSPFIIQTFEFKLLWPLREFISSQFELWAQLDTRQMLLPNWVFQVIKVPYCHFFPQGFGGLSFTIHTRSTFISGNIPSISWLGGR